MKRFDSIGGIDKTEPVTKLRIGWPSILILLVISNIVLYLKYKVSNN